MELPRKIVVGEKNISDIGAFLKSLEDPKSVSLISGNNVKKIVQKKIEKSLSTSKIKYIWHLAKTIDRKSIIEIEKNVLRNKSDLVIGIGGGRERNIRVNLNFDRMSAFGITVQDIVRAFRNEHIKLPGGFLIENSKEELLKLDLEYHSPEDVGNIIVAYTNNNPIKLKNIAQIEDDVSDLRNLARFQGKPAIGLGVV